MALDAVRAALADDPSRVGFFSDLDGTLANIVDDPDSVVPVDGLPERVTALAEHLGVVAVVSGRPVSFLDRFFSPPVELSGLYGLEHRSGSRLFIDSTALEWLPVMSVTADRARERFGLEAVEDKRYSLTIHYRDDPEQADAIITWAQRTAEQTGLHAGVAKMSVELHPPTSRSKGDAVEELLTGIDVAVYCGDDVGDRPAFERLASLDRGGRLDAHAIVLIASDETAPELREHATDVLHAPAEMIGLLDDLIGSIPT